MPKSITYLEIIEFCQMRNFTLLLIICSYSCTSTVDSYQEKKSNDSDLLEKKGCKNNCFSSDITDNYLGFNVYTYPENATAPWINDHAFISWDYSNSNTILTNSAFNCNTEVLVEFKSIAGVTDWNGYYSLFDDYFAVDISSEFLANPQGDTVIIVGDYSNSSSGVYDVRIIINARCGKLGCCQTSEWISICACYIP